MLNNRQEQRLELILRNWTGPELQRDAIRALQSHARQNSVRSPQDLLNASYLLWPELREVMLRGPKVPTWWALRNGAVTLQRLAVSEMDRDSNNEDKWQHIFAVSGAIIEFCFLLPKSPKTEIYSRWKYVGRCKYCWRLAPAGRASPRHPIRCFIHFHVSGPNGIKARRLLPLVQYEYKRLEKTLRHAGLVRTPLLAHELATDRVKADDLGHVPGWYSESDIEAWFTFLPNLKQYLAASKKDPIKDDPASWIGSLLSDDNPDESEIGLQTKKRVFELIANDLRLGLFLLIWAEAWLTIANEKRHGGFRLGAGRKKLRGSNKIK